MAGFGVVPGASPWGAAERGRPDTSPADAQFFDQGTRNFLEETRRNAGFGKIGSVAAAVYGAPQDQLIHGAGHADVAEAAFFFDVLGDKHSARVREETFFEPAQEDEGEFESFGGMQAHERDLGARVVVIGVGDESCVV